MFSIRLCFIVIFCLSNTKPEILKNMDGNVDRFVEISLAHSNDSVKVIIKNHLSVTEVDERSIFLPKNTGGDDVKYINKTDAFYTALSCSIGQMTMNSLYDSIKSSPLLYQNEYSDMTVESKFQPNILKNDISALITYVKENTWKHIQMLNNVLQKKADSSYYRQTYTQDALLSLYIRIHFISSSIDDRQQSHDNVVRKILSEMTVLQRSLAINCTSLSDVADTNAHVYYSFYINVHRIDRVKVNEFLNLSMDLMELDSGDRCSPEEIILESFILSQEDEFSKEIARAIVSIKSNKNVSDVSIGDIYDRVLRQMYDFETLFSYQESVTATIVKILFREILHNPDALSDENVKSSFDTLFGFIFNHDTVLPDRLVDGIAILSNYYKSNNKNAIDKLQQFYNNSFTDIALTAQAGDAKTNLDVTSIVTRINKNIVDSKCFQEMYKYLRSKRDRYYLPNTSYEGASFPDGEDQEHLKAVCDFAIAVNALCLQTITFAQQDLDSFYDHTKEHSNFKSRPFLYIKIILHFFLLIVERNPADKALTKMAYTVAPILLNVAANEKDMKYRLHVVQWVLQIVMAELNNVAMTYCVSLETNVLLFYRVYFNELGNGEAITSTLLQFYKQSVDINFMPCDLNMTESLSIDNFRYWNVTDLYNAYIGSSKLYKEYENVIKFYWYGSVKTLKEIYGDIISIVTNPQNLNAIYDMYFKFYVVAVYYEICHILNVFDDLYTNIASKFQQIIDLNILSKDIFPRGLHSFIRDIDNLLRLPSTSKHLNNEFKKELLAHKNKIGKLLVELNISVVFNFDSKQIVTKKPRILSSCLLKTNNIPSYFFPNQNFIEGKSNIKNMYNKFTKIIFDY